MKTFAVETTCCHNQEKAETKKSLHILAESNLYMYNETCFKKKKKMLWVIYFRVNISHLLWMVINQNTWIELVSVCALYLQISSISLVFSWLPLQARNKLDGCYYAIKRIPLEERTVQFNSKIVREVKLLSRLNHENVVRWVVNASLLAAGHHDIGLSGYDISSSHENQPHRQSFAKKKIGLWLFMQ